MPAARVGPCPVPCDMRADAVFVFGWRAPAPLALVCGVRGPARRGLWFLRLGVRVHGCLSCDARGRAGPDQATRRDVGCRCGVGWRRETEYENGVHNGKALLFLNFEITSGIPRGPRASNSPHFCLILTFCLLLLPSVWPCVCPAAPHSRSHSPTSASTAAVSTPRPQPQPQPAPSRAFLGPVPASSVDRPLVVACHFSGVIGIM